MYYLKECLYSIKEYFCYIKGYCFCIIGYVIYTIGINNDAVVCKTLLKIDIYQDGNVSVPFEANEDALHQCFSIAFFFRNFIGFECAILLLENIAEGKLWMIGVFSQQAKTQVVKVVKAVFFSDDKPSFADVL